MTETWTPEQYRQYLRDQGLEVAEPGDPEVWTVEQYREWEAGQGKGKKRKNKFNARGERFDNIWFDSQAELRRYRELKLLVQAGEISQLKAHPVFTLVEGETFTLTYEADFQYIEDGKTVVEDVKGGEATQTAAFKKKWKMAQEIYPDIDWRIITR